MPAELWTTIALSLRIALTATAVATLLAVPLAFIAARKRVPFKTLLEVIVLLPLVLPPTVVGYFIIIVLGAQGWIGSHLKQWFDYSILFRFEGAVLAAATVAVPLIYLPAKAGFASIDREFEDIARSFGAGAWQLFWQVSLPLARRAILSGVLLGFARALGEFGATVMVYGWQPGKVTLPISIYAYYEQGELSRATPAVVVLSGISLVMIVAYNATAKRD